MTRGIIITGAGGGIGADLARRAARDGYRVGVLDVAGDQAATVAQEVDGVALYASVTDENQVTEAFETFGPVDAVIHNAGIVRFGPLLDHRVEDWRAVVDVNLTGCFIVGRAAARAMGEDGGAIVTIGSMNGVAPGPNAGAYGATKAAIHLLTQQMALEWAPRIRVNAIAPGLIDAGMSVPIYTDPDSRRAREARVPAGRLGTGVDIANAAMWLLGDEASYVTGQTLVVDGGVTMSVITSLPRPTSVDGSGDGSGDGA